MSGAARIVAAMSTTITTTTTRQLTELPTDMLERFRARAGELDRTNTYFHEDLAELRALGYLAAAVPAAPRRLGPRPRRAGRQPAPPGPLRPGDGAGDDACTPTGSASPPSSSGPATTSLRWILEAAVDGEVFAAGHAEAGNDIPVLLSTCRRRAGRGRLPPDRPQAVRLQRPGLDAGSAPTPSTPTRPAGRRSCTPSSSARAPA